MLREGRIILPKTARGHDLIRREASKLFGGYTETEGRDGWINDQGELEQEQVRIYDIAMDTGDKSAALLRRLAQALLLKSNEVAIHVRYADSTVEIIEKDA